MVFLHKELLDDFVDRSNSISEIVGLQTIPQFKVRHRCPSGATFDDCIITPSTKLRKCRNAIPWNDKTVGLTLGMY
jgi:hypothetical protein